MMMYVILAVGIAATLVSMFSRKSAPKLCVAMQIVTLAALLAAGIYFAAAVQQGSAFMEALTGRFS